MSKDCSTCKYLDLRLDEGACATCNDDYSEYVRDITKGRAPVIGASPFPAPDTPKAVQGTGAKYDAGKPMWGLLMHGCAKAVAGVVAILTFGASKYSANSWQTVPDGYSRYKDAMYRHLHAIESGEFIDPESGKPHWHHVACNVLFCSELWERDNVKSD